MTGEHTPPPEQLNCCVCGARTVSTVGKKVDGRWYCYNCAPTPTPAVETTASAPGVCVWTAEKDSSRRWLGPSCDSLVDHEDPRIVRGWRHCPYCGGEIVASPEKAPGKYTENQIREFCGYVTAYLTELHQTHPGSVWDAWESYLKQPSQKVSYEQGEPVWLCTCPPPGNVNSMTVSVCKDCGTAQTAGNIR